MNVICAYVGQANKYTPCTINAICMTEHRERHGRNLVQNPMGSRASNEDEKRRTKISSTKDNNNAFAKRERF